MLDDFRTGGGNRRRGPPTPPTPGGPLFMNLALLIADDDIGGVGTGRGIPPLPVVFSFPANDDLRGFLRRGGCGAILEDVVAVVSSRSSTSSPV